ncbi:MAG TPA: hypothetical protein ENF83_04265 [Candidatus Korarchaeota archaeon]|nr:hypothetical protein [Candidatus Korarchaeota archaeon]
MSWRVIVDHCTLGKVALWYGALVVLTGLALLTAPKSRLIRRAAPYLRLVHLILGLMTALMGLWPYLSSP